MTELLDVRCQLSIKEMYKIGTGKAEIKCFKPGVGMMGYGMPHHKAVEQESIVYARAFAVEHPETATRFVFVNTESAFVTIAIKKAVLDRLTQQYPQWGYNHSNCMFTAQHTHSAPGGYSHYAIYNMSIPGFQPLVFNANVDAIFEAIVQAEGNKRDGEMRVGAGMFDENHEAVKNAIKDVIEKVKAIGKPIGICGQGPSDSPNFARFLVELGIDSISFNPDAYLKGLENVLEAEKVAVIT